MGKLEEMTEFSVLELVKRPHTHSLALTAWRDWTTYIYLFKSWCLCTFLWKKRCHPSLLILTVRSYFTCCLNAREEGNHGQKLFNRDLDLASTLMPVFWFLLLWSELADFFLGQLGDLHSRTKGTFFSVQTAERGISEKWAVQRIASTDRQK